MNKAKAIYLALGFKAKRLAFGGFASQVRRCVGVRCVMKYVQNVVRPKGCNFKQNRNPFHLTRRQLFARISYPPISRKQVIEFARRAAEFLLRKFCEMEKGSQRQEK